MEEKVLYKRNLFEIENARNLTREEMVRTFVPTKAFWRLLSSKNHIVLGSRGSGKTALAKMLSHSHLALLQDDRAQIAIKSKSFIGIYVPTRIEWVGGLKNKAWQTERDKEEFFQWRLNIAACLSFLDTVQSCLDVYVEDKLGRAKAEENLVKSLAMSWSDEQTRCVTIRELRNLLEDIEHTKQLQLTRKRITGHLKDNEEPLGVAFEAALFEPLRRGITLAARVLNLPTEAVWFLCLDEAEFLEPLHHRILNTHLRSYSGNLVFKITTMPYSHYTLETNTGVSLNVGQDFEYVYIDQDPVMGQSHNTGEEESFAQLIFRKRAEGSQKKYHRLNLKSFLGVSTLLEEKVSYWSKRSLEMKLLRKHADENTIRRAAKLEDSPREFADQISRKIHGALLLREAVRMLAGRAELDVYSGDLMMIRCSDANPRRLIRLFNSLLLEAKWSGKKIHALTKKAQTRILTAFSTSALTRVQSEPELGPDLFKILTIVGDYMNFTLHVRPLSTDQVSSIKTDMSISSEHHKVIKRAVELGLLYPNKNVNNPDQIPYRDGTYHLAYVLSPHFKLLPRRGKAVKLSTIFRKSLSKDQTDSQLNLGLDDEGTES